MNENGKREGAFVGLFGGGGNGGFCFRIYS